MSARVGRAPVCAQVMSRRANFSIWRALVLAPPVVVVVVVAVVAAASSSPWPRPRAHASRVAAPCLRITQMNRQLACLAARPAKVLRPPAKEAAPNNYAPPAGGAKYLPSLVRAPIKSAA